MILEIGCERRRQDEDATSKAPPASPQDPVDVPDHVPSGSASDEEWSSVEPRRAADARNRLVEQLTDRRRLTVPLEDESPRPPTPGIQRDSPRPPALPRHAGLAVGPGLRHVGVFDPGEERIPLGGIGHEPRACSGPSRTPPQSLNKDAPPLAVSVWRHGLSRHGHSLPYAAYGPSARELSGHDPRCRPSSRGPRTAFYHVTGSGRRLDTPASPQGRGSGGRAGDVRQAADRRRRRPRRRASSAPADGQPSRRIPRPFSVRSVLLRQAATRWLATESGGQSIREGCHFARGQRLSVQWDSPERGTPWEIHRS